MNINLTSIASWLAKFNIQLSINEATKSNEAIEKFEDTSDVNLTAFIAGRLSELSMQDSTYKVEEVNKRAEFINLCVNKYWEKGQEILFFAEGTGETAVAPTVYEGNIYPNIISRNNVFVIEETPTGITKAIILSDTKKVGTQTYYKWVLQIVENNNLVISVKTTKENGSEAFIEEWQQDDVIIPNFYRVLFTFVKGTKIDKKTKKGAPITYGCDKDIARYKQVLKDLDEEFESKKGVTYVDDRAFDFDESTGKRKVGKFLRAIPQSNDFIYQDHSPTFRIEAYLQLKNTIGRDIEKQINISEGILSVPTTTTKTATEIELSQRETTSMINTIQTKFANSVKDYAELCDIIANFYNLAPMGEYDIGFNFGEPYADTEKAWRELKELRAEGGATIEELRAWKFPDEDAETTEKVLEKVRAENPSLADTLGNLNAFTG